MSVSKKENVFLLLKAVEKALIQDLSTNKIVFYHWNTIRRRFQEWKPVSERILTI